ncbi:MAG: hypothetical protein HFH82_10045 [Lachnospiraceae bacterium]|nr:hypothetical protein [Lachnospiraceae bacterium]
MKYGGIHMLAKIEENCFCMWKVMLPRQKIYEIRQEEGEEFYNLSDLFERIPLVGTQAKGKMNFIILQGPMMQLITKDMGENFVELNLYNGKNIVGTQKEIMEMLQDSLQKQGCNFQNNAFLKNVDVLETLEKIVECNTDYYQSDFRYDRNILLEAAVNKEASKNFFWMSRANGVWCFPERDVYIKHTNAYNLWTFYGENQEEHVRAFFVRLKEIVDGKVRGDVLELDYQKHLDYICTRALAPTHVKVVSEKNDNSYILGYEEYISEWPLLVGKFGIEKQKTYLVENEIHLDCIAAKGRNMFWNFIQGTEVDNYIRRLEAEKLKSYGYTAGDMMLIGQGDAKTAVKNGLKCYSLNNDGTKEILLDEEDYSKAVGGKKLFGMELEEKELLQSLNQMTIPLFNHIEMQRIYEFLLQAGMENEVEQNGVLNGMIHKTECFLSWGEAVEQEVTIKEWEASQDEIIQ